MILSKNRPGPFVMLRRKLRSWLNKWKYQACWDEKHEMEYLYACKCGGEKGPARVFCRECPYYTHYIWSKERKI